MYTKQKDLRRSDTRQLFFNTKLVNANDLSTTETEYVLKGKAVQFKLLSKGFKSGVLCKVGTHGQYFELSDGVIINGEFDKIYLKLGSLVSGTYYRYSGFIEILYSEDFNVFKRDSNILGYSNKLESQSIASQSSSPFSFYPAGATEMLLQIYWEEWTYNYDITITGFNGSYSELILNQTDLAKREFRAEINCFGYERIYVTIGNGDTENSRSCDITWAFNAHTVKPVKIIDLYLANDYAKNVGASSNEELRINLDYTDLYMFDVNLVLDEDDTHSHDVEMWLVSEAPDDNEETFAFWDNSTDTEHTYMNKLINRSYKDLEIKITNNDAEDAIQIDMLHIRLYFQ